MPDKSIFKIEDIASLRFYTEGPVIDNEGNLYVTTLTGGAILKIDKDRNVSEWAHSECPNGQTILANGDHLVCDSKEASIKRYSAEGKFIRNEIKGVIGEHEVFCPNDVIVDGAGNIYFTDSVRHKGKVYCLGIDGENYLVADGLDYPNGLVLAEDRNILYVAESYKNRIIAITLTNLPRNNTEIEVFCELPQHPSGNEIGNLPDGVVMDSEMNLWIAHYGMAAVQVVNRNGVLLKSINTDLPLTSNLMLTDRNTLIVTGGYAEPGPGAVKEISLENISLKLIR